MTGSAQQSPAKLQKRGIFVRILKRNQSLKKKGKERKGREGREGSGKRREEHHISTAEGEENYLSYFNKDFNAKQEFSYKSK